ncbi:MAG: NAD(P)/FAD-dependent oxidoreductase [Gemmatimonadales bacterium]
MISDPANPEQAGRVGIVGGGILGMTLALRLQSQGYQVTILEAAPEIGGLAGAHSIGGYTWDRYYHVILQSDRHLRGLLEELRLADVLRWNTTRTGFYTDGRLHSLSNSVEFLRFPALSLVDKARLAATILYASRVRDWRPLERIPVTDWLRRLSGKRTFERIWLPLLKSKLGENYRITSASFIWATIARMYAARRSGLKREMFGYVEGGYARILSRFGAELESRGVRILCGQPAASVSDHGQGVDVRVADGTTHSFDRVILTVSCPRVESLCPQLSPGERARLGKVVYQGITCASMLLRRPLADFYITNITEAWVPFTAVIEMTALVDRRHFGGNALVYLPRYLAQNDRFWAAKPDEIREQFLAALERMYPDFRRSDVLAFEVSKVRDMLAITTLDYTDRAKPEMQTSLPNVFIVNSAQIANGTLNVNETVALANDRAAQLRARLASRSHTMTAVQN